ncbi:MAG: hypothetical protein ACRC62_30375 [Microcoleus sp.]
MVRNVQLLKVAIAHWTMFDSQHEVSLKQLPITDCRVCDRCQQKKGIIVKSWRLNFQQNQPYVV